jgi:hypothetical protein
MTDLIINDGVTQFGNLTVQHGLAGATKTETTTLLRSLEYYVLRIGSADWSMLVTRQHRLI